MKNSESFDEDKAKEGLSILKWFFKMAVFVMALGLISYFFDGEIGLGGLFSALIFAGFIHIILSTMGSRPC